MKKLIFTLTFLMSSFALAKGDCATLVQQKSEIEKGIQQLKLAIADLTAEIRIASRDQYTVNDVMALKLDKDLKQAALNKITYDLRVVQKDIADQQCQ